MSFDLSSKLKTVKVDGAPVCTYYDLFKGETPDEIFHRILATVNARLYVEDLTQRDYSLENTTPYQLEISGKVFTDRAWGNLLCNVTEYLLTLHPEALPDLFDMRSPWSKRVMFSATPQTNSKLIQEGLYINVNHTALHSCWFLQDLLDFFHVDKDSVLFLLYRPSGAEPKIVRYFLSARTKSAFQNFLVQECGKSAESAEKSVRIIVKYLNPILRKISRSYVDLFLFDEVQRFTIYMSRLTEEISNDLTFTEKQKNVLLKNLAYLRKFYKSL